MSQEEEDHISDLEMELDDLRGRISDKDQEIEDIQLQLKNLKNKIQEIAKVEDQMECSTLVFNLAWDIEQES